MPASSAISSMLAAWKPRREKTLHRRVEHLLLADGPGQALEAGAVDTWRAYLLVRKVTRE